MSVLSAAFWPEPLWITVTDRQGGGFVAESAFEVFGGVDTHRDIHVGAVVDTAGRVLGSESFTADRAGYRRLVAWMRSRGRLVRVGVEGCGSYGAGLDE